MCNVIYSIKIYQSSDYISDKTQGRDQYSRPYCSNQALFQGYSYYIIHILNKKERPSTFETAVAVSDFCEI